MRAQQVTGPIAHHGEGPVWWARWGGLRWVDMLAGDILSLDASGEVRRRHVSRVVAAIRPRRGGGSVMGVERGFALEEPDGTIRRLPALWADEGVRMNEGACDPDGRFYCGSMAYDRRKHAGALYRLALDGTVDVVMRDVTVSNGLVWNPQGSLAYYTDTDTQRITALRYEAGSGFAAARTFAEIGAEDGRPDGLTVDAEGGVWVALNGGGTVRRYSAEGVIDELIVLPTAKVTACTFGGADLDELFITTSREDLGPADDPLAGSLFSARMGVAGVPVREFAA